MLFQMGPTSEEEIEQKEPLTYALYKWLDGMHDYGFATLPGDDQFYYRSLKGDLAHRLNNYDFNEQEKKVKELKVTLARLTSELDEPDQIKPKDKRNEKLRFFLNWQMPKEISKPLHKATSEQERSQICQSWLNYTAISEELELPELTDVHLSIL